MTMMMIKIQCQDPVPLVVEVGRVLAKTSAREIIFDEKLNAICYYVVDLTLRSGHRRGPKFRLNPDAFITIISCFKLPDRNGKCVP